jgi:DNA invertase Pin-like site-specific DNA recombinase
MIRAAAKRSGWRLASIEEDVQSAASTQCRPGLERALARCRQDSCAGIVVAKLDRLSRSLLDFASLVEDARAEGWNIVALDHGVDLNTPEGELLAGVLALVAQWERRIISARTKAALSVKRSQGVRLGRAAKFPPLEPGIPRRIRRLHAHGSTWAAIAERLNAEGGRAPAGGAWNEAAVRRAASLPSGAKRRRTS